MKINTINSCLFSSHTYIYTHVDMNKTDQTTLYSDTTKSSVMPTTSAKYIEM